MVLISIFVLSGLSLPGVPSEASTRSQTWIAPSAVHVAMRVPLVS